MSVSLPQKAGREEASTSAEAAIHPPAACRMPCSHGRLKRFFGGRQGRTEIAGNELKKRVASRFGSLWKMPSKCKGLCVTAFAGTFEVKSRDD